MFTMKKLALISAAGLAALSISCSDSDTDDVITGFDVTDSTAGIKISGEVTAPEGATVSAIVVTADGNAVSFVAPGPTFGTNKVVLSNFVSGVCAGKSGNVSVNFAIAATISDGTNATATKNGVSVACPADPGGSTGGTYVLSLAGKSYLDVDGGQTYGQTEMAAIKDIIDLVAFYKEGAQNKVFGACDVETIALDCNTYVALYNYSGASDIDSIKDAKDDIFEGDETEPGEGIAIANGKIFLLESSELGEFAVTITTSGTDTVTLRVVAIDD
jgi:hypothetical protein